MVVNIHLLIIFYLYIKNIMKSKKPLAVRIFIRICVVAMIVSLVWVYIMYMFPAQQNPGITDETVNTWAEVETENIDWNNGTIILPEIDPENPENTGAPILVTEEWEMDEMDQVIEVQLENGNTEIVRQWDLSDVLQINQ